MLEQLLLSYRKKVYRNTSSSDFARQHQAESNRIDQIELSLVCKVLVVGPEKLAAAYCPHCRLENSVQKMTLYTMSSRT